MLRGHQTSALMTRYSSFIRETLLALTADPDVIAYRQAVFNDFLDNPRFAEWAQQLLPRLADLRMGNALFGKRQRSVLLETADRLSELDLFLTVIQELHQALAETTLRSEALTQLAQSLLGIINSETFKDLKQKLPELQRPLAHFSSLTVGINLNAQLRPKSAILLSINEKPLAEAKSMLARLLGMRGEDDDESGIAPLHQVPDDPQMRILSPLFQDLEHLIMETVQPVVRALTRYVGVSSSPLVGLERELAFYVSAVRMVKGIQAHGVPFCQPEIAPVDERMIQIDGLVNLNLALRDPKRRLVGNDVRFDDEGRIATLTGPNSGGKTTYLQAVGIAQVLFQAGLAIPARVARISPVDGIYTHFPALETQQQGRLAEEAARLRTVCVKATAQSLVLMNESFSSTTANEALYLAQDLLSGLRFIGVRAIFATHLVELVDRLTAMEQAIEGASRFFSLVAHVELVEDASGEIHATPTFQIQRGMPQGRSYAQEIARRYGISLDQILQARRTT
jgi:DNA mismatch repair ATPase MutS